MYDIEYGCAVCGYNVKFRTNHITAKITPCPDCGGHYLDRLSLWLTYEEMVKRGDFDDS